MASANTYEAGIGGTSGDRLATADPLYVGNGGFVWYVGNTVVGAADAAATGGALDGGRRREKPLLTLSQAITNSADGDIIVFLANHAETLSGAVTINKKVTLTSEGTGTSAAKFTAAGAINMLDVTVANVRMRNIRFPASTAAPTAKVRIATAGCQLIDCYMECGALDTNRALSLVTGAGQVRLSGCTFIATAATPAVAVEVINAVTGLDVEDCTFDGGAFGWTSYAFQGTSALTNYTFLNTHLLNGSDAHITTGSTGWFQRGTASGSSVVRIDA